MSRKRSVADADVAGKRVLVRVDFNVPLLDGIVTDDTRIRAVLPTLNLLIDRGARVIVISHLGRPAERGYEEPYSLRPVALKLSELLNLPVVYVPDISGRWAQSAAASLKDGEVLMLENLRFDEREKENDPEFAAELAALGDIYVNDAFGCAHRAHASITEITKLLPTYAGLLLAEEVSTLTGMLEDPERPFVAILGGSKVSDKIGVIDNMSKIVDVILIGGGMCFTFMRALGYDVGMSLVEENWIDRAAEMLKTAKDRGCRILLPVDYVVADRFVSNANTQVVAADAIPDDWMGLDIGPETEKLYAAEIAKAKTIFWNGPMGVFEMEAFAEGTRAIGAAITANTDCTSIIGGGDSAAAVKKFGFQDDVTFISTGGGASMELVKGASLPAVEAIPDEER